MPRYFFHTLDGARHRDEDGEICAGPEQARDEARALFGEVLGRGDSGFTTTSDFTVLCTDDAGRPLVAFTASTVTGSALQALAGRFLEPGR